MSKYLVSLSKTISHALRHAPNEYGLTLDQQGWVNINNLVFGISKKNKQFAHATREDIQKIIESFDKQRFEILGDNIRAIYGHSTEEAIGYRPSKPPNKLYHGTTAEAAKKILVEGLKPMSRQYVHLSSDLQTATKVALRRTNSPIMFDVSADQAFRDGVRFYQGNDKVWLVEFLDPKYISKK